MMRKPLTITFVALLALAGSVTFINRHQADASGELARLVLDVPASGGSWRLHANGLVWAPEGVAKPAALRVPKGSTLVDAVATPSGQGVWALTNRGRIVRSGDARAMPRLGRLRVRGQVAAIAALPNGTGLFIVGVNGTISTYGKAPNLGTVANLPSKVVDAAVTPSGAGLWLVTAAGHIYALGDAPYLGGTGVSPVEPVTGITPTPSGKGYWIVSADGGVFNVGDAGFRGSLGGIETGQDVVGLQPDRDGYRLLGAFDRVDPFGNGAPPPVGIPVPPAPAQPKGAPSSPVVTAGGPWFANAAWLYAPVPSGARLDPLNANLAAALTAPGTNRVVDIYDFGVPVYEADASTPRYQLDVRNGGTTSGKWGTNDLMTGTVPIPDGAVAAPGSDAKIVIVDRPNNKVYDLWAASDTGSGWSAAWGGVYPLDGDGTSHNPGYQNGVRWPNPVSRGTGSGISSLSGLITTEEIAAGQINHALVFSTDITCGPANTGPFRYPATTTDGSGSGNCVPEGTRVQLDPSVDLAAIPGISKAELAVGRALQTYGAYVIDRGGARMAFIAEMPTASSGNPYPAAGFGGDYSPLPRLPWNTLRVLASWDGS